MALITGGTLPCVWLAHATSGDSVTNNLSYLPSTTSWMTDSTCWIGQEYQLTSDVQRRWKNNKFWGKSLRRLNRTAQEWPFVYYAGIHDQPRLQREGGRKGKLNDRFTTQNGLWTVVRAFIWRRSSAGKPVEKAVQWNSVNTITFGPWKIGRINGVIVLKGFFK